MYTPEDYLTDAIESVSAWDLNDDEFDQAVNDQAYLMAGKIPDHYWDCSPEFPCTSHR